MPGVLLAVLTGFLIVKSGWRRGLGLWWTAEKPKLEWVVAGGWWWGALGAAVLVLGLLLSAKLWAKRWPAAFPLSANGLEATAASPSGIRGAAPRWLWLAVGLLMLAGAAVRAPRLHLSLYNDEAHVFRAHVAGSVPKAFLGQPDKFKPVPWLATFYENRAGNNSMPFSLASRLSYDAWRKLSGAAPGQVNETALRLPVLFAGVAAIGAMAWLGFRLGGTGLAVLAGVVTAFHPWHARYSVEARGYGILMLAIPLMFIVLDKALRSGRWRWWLAFAGMQYFALACWFGMSHVLVGLHLSLVAMAVAPAVRTRRMSAVRGALLAPGLVSGVVALGVFLVLNLPQFVQLSKALAHPAFFKNPHPFPAEWLQDVAGYLTCGIPGLPVSSLDGADKVLTNQPSVAGLIHGQWGPMGVVLMAAAGLVFAGGLARLLVRTMPETRRGLFGRKSRLSEDTTDAGKPNAGEAAASSDKDGIKNPSRQNPPTIGISPTAILFAGATLGGAILTFGYCSVKGIAFLKWYSIFLLPGLLMGMAACLKSLTAPGTHNNPIQTDSPPFQKNTPGSPGSSWPCPTSPKTWLAAAALTAVLAAWVPGLRTYSAQSRENLRGAVEVARRTEYPQSLTNPTGTLLATLWTEAPVYDPSATTLISKADLESLMRRAASENRPLFVAQAHTAEAEASAPQIMALLRDPSQFQKTATLPGLDETANIHQVWRFLGSPPPP